MPPLGLHPVGLNARRPKVKKAKLPPAPKKPPRTRAVAPRSAAPPLDPAMAAYQNYYNAAANNITTQNRNQAMWLANLYKGMAGSLQDTPNQIQGVYRNAAADQSAFGQGYSDALKHLQQGGAANVNSMLQGIGAPQGQMLQPGPQAGNVLNALGGAIPANTLEGQGAAFASAASFLPAAAIGQGQMQIGSLARQGQQALSDLQLQKAKELPGLIMAQQAAKAKQQQFDATMAYRWTALDAQNKRALLADRRQAQRIYIEQKRLGLTAQNQSFNQWLKQQQLSISQQRADTSSYNATKPTYRNINGQIVAIDPATGNAVPIYTSPPGRSANGKIGGYTALQISHFKSQAADTARAAYYGGFYDNKGKWHSVGEKSYVQAYLDMVHHGIPGWVAAQSLNVYWKKPGYDRTFGKKGHPSGWTQSNTGRPMRDFASQPGKGGAGAEPAAYAGASWRGKRVLNKQEIMQLWVQAGGDPRLANTMADIALRESGGRVDAFNPNARTGDYSVGLWQINYFGNLRGPRTRRYGTPERLRSDPMANARAAVDLAAGGRGLTNWSTYHG